MRFIKAACCFLFIVSFFIGCGQRNKQNIESNKIRGWTILSDNREMAVKAIDHANEYNINHLQFSHKIVRNLNDIKDSNLRVLVNELTDLAHRKNIKEVTLWDHALYKMDYYPDSFKVEINRETLIDLDNPGFWAWLKNDYREMLDLVPEIDGLILTFIETGSRAERQYSKKMLRPEEKLAAVVKAVSDVVVKERNLKLYLRTFIHHRDELDPLLKCFRTIESHPNIIVMTKEVPHDFFITHPPSYWVKDMPHPVIIEFDCAHEYNGQGIIASIFPKVHYNRWKYYQTLPNVIGYVNRTDRYGDTQIIGRPSEINLYAIKRIAEDPGISINEITDEFIIKQYGRDALEQLRFVFNSAPGIMTSTLYTLGMCLNNHSKLDFDHWQSYSMHISGNWMEEPFVTVEHGVDKTFHYWKDIINHLAVPEYKPKPDGKFKWNHKYPFGNHLKPEWFDYKEMMNMEYLNDIITEKEYGIKLCNRVLQKIKEAESLISDSKKYLDLYHTFNRTRISGEVYLATLKALLGYRIYKRGVAYRSLKLTGLIREGLRDILRLADEIDNYPEKGPIGQQDWSKDADRARAYYKTVTRKLGKDFDVGEPSRQNANPQKAF